MGGAVGQHDFAAGILAERIGALVQPEEAGEREPAAIGLQRRLTRPRRQAAISD